MLYAEATKQMTQETQRLETWDLYFMEWKDELGRKEQTGVVIPHSIPSLTTDLLRP